MSNITVDHAFGVLTAGQIVEDSDLLPALSEPTHEGASDESAAASYQNHAAAFCQN